MEHLSSLKWISLVTVVERECVCVCVCVSEREREREIVSMRKNILG